MTQQIITDNFGRHTCGNYSIEPWKNEDGSIKSYSIYNRFNSMYDCRDGFKTIEEAKDWINKWRA